MAASLICTQMATVAAKRMRGGHYVTLSAAAKVRGDTGAVRPASETSLAPARGKQVPFSPWCRPLAFGIDPRERLGRLTLRARLL